MDVKDIKIDDELKNLLPPLSEDELKGLEEDIRKHGVLDPIILWNDFIADGHNRYSICRKLGIESVDAKELHKDSKAEVMEWIIDHQFARRNLTKSQIVLSREKVRKKYAEEAKKRLSPGINQYTDRSTVNLPQTTDKKRNPTTDEKIAEKIGVSERTYRNMRLITFEGTPEQIKRMDKGGKGNGVSAIANEIRDRKDGVPEGFRKCTKCGVIKPISEFGKGNARHCKSCVHSPDDKEIAKEEVPDGFMKCRKCGEIKKIEDFSRGGATHQCKDCYNKQIREYRASTGITSANAVVANKLKDENKDIDDSWRTTKQSMCASFEVFMDAINFSINNMKYDRASLVELLSSFVNSINKLSEDIKNDEV